ncbi:MAG: hypothetical protein LBB26_03485 [Puniceicoccales bacterium]|jgi:hypothetical protein|nr:hypothetical protein [Puniceicoccales bacterium]
MKEIIITAARIPDAFQGALKSHFNNVPRSTIGRKGHLKYSIELMHTTGESMET